MLRKTGAEVDLMRFRGGAAREVVVVSVVEVEAVGVEEGALARKGVEREEKIGGGGALLVEVEIEGSLGFVEVGAEEEGSLSSESITVAQIWKRNENKDQRRNSRAEEERSRAHLRYISDLPTLPTSRRPPIVLLLLLQSPLLRETSELSLLESAGEFRRDDDVGIRFVGGLEDW